MLANGVERPAVPPREQVVPLVRVLVDEIERRCDSVRLVDTARIGEARRRTVQRLLAARQDRPAARNRGPSRVTAEVHVHVAASTLPVVEEAHEVAAVLT